ncbi:hypothetical protein [Thermogutta sp.]|uniref:hypothetical protein n=1 Tax=Thermogutta sp. TaxID=1962930 RepID=UPI00321FA510
MRGNEFRITGPASGDIHAWWEMVEAELDEGNEEFITRKIFGLSVRGRYGYEEELPPGTLLLAGASLGNYQIQSPLLVVDWTNPKGWSSRGGQLQISITNVRPVTPDGYRWARSIAPDDWARQLVYADLQLRVRQLEEAVESILKQL